WDLAADLGIVDFERGAKVVGAGFPFYVGAGARLQRALISFFLDLAAEAGYREIQPPLLVNAASATGTGQLPDKEDMMYEVGRDELYLIPTAEVPVTNFLRDEIVADDDLPVKFCAYTPCFRREAGSYGKHVRGLNRLHQFDKVELVQFVRPEDSYDALESMTRDAERAIERLGLPYRRLLMCTGDMGFSQAKKYDLEVWSAGQERWLEVSSISNVEAFQARRTKTRFRPSEGKKTDFVHTLNGSALALPRVVAAILENYQTEDGKISVPASLQPYMRAGTIE
ncbi:MAG: serine--tRNA ligase, partial [Rhodothermales bacterium]|nr:serine--tRNA ligase [Rhodothermales bacterium]